MIDVQVRLFAMVRDLAETELVTLSVPPGATAAAVVDALVRRFPQLERWKPYLRVAVNCRYTQADEAVRAGDEIAVIPPVSGG